ncbi:MAG: FAD-dependent oxidoreductase [Thermoplasmata archaeon]|jgi:heterodisulfide reductase subunit A|uniref:FAD-dependent oxidoreductase n=1 Tax=Caldisericum sp. TaxID=2499687 RepID=UPI003CADB90C
MNNENKFDVLVIGAGIAGMEASINMGDLGFKVLLVEKTPSIGGTMILLSKVFPTLDCASCICTPKMSSVMHHENIKTMTYSEIKEITKKNGGFTVKIIKKPRYVIENKCTGCGQCEMSCPVIVPDQYNFGLVGRKAAYIPFSNAAPRIAVIDIDNCVLCGMCERICPANAIDFSQKEEEILVEVKSIIIATGFDLFPAGRISNFGYGRFKNVITSMQMERLLAPTRPFNTVLRPSDGKIPSKIAYILCAGSRDKTLGNPICSQICCMYSIKQAQLLLGALPLVEISIFYIDIRAFGKGFEEFYQQAKDMGIRFVKGKISKIEEKKDGNLLLKYENIENSGRLTEEEFDLVVLSVGILPTQDLLSKLKDLKLEVDEASFIKSYDKLSPVKTNIPGVFVAGAAFGPKDIPDTINSSGAASAEAAAFIKHQEG